MQIAFAFSSFESVLHLKAFTMYAQYRMNGIQHDMESFNCEGREAGSRGIHEIYIVSFLSCLVFTYDVQDNFWASVYNSYLLT